MYVDKQLFATFHKYLLIEPIKNRYLLIYERKRFVIEEYTQRKSNWQRLTEIVIIDC